MKPLKLGLVGTGGRGRSVLRTLSQEPFIELCGVADVNPAAVDAAAREFQVPGYRNAAELMEESGCEAIFLATPHPFHAPDACEAARRGVHVMVEKPLAVTVVEADEMIATAEKYGVVLGTSFNRRTEPLRARVKQLVDEGALGQLLDVEVTRTSWYRTQAYYDQAAWRGRSCQATLA